MMEDIKTVGDGSMTSYVEREYKGHTIHFSDPGLVSIKVKRGGKVPAKLQGQFTGVAEAQKAIDIYLAGQSVEKVPQDKNTREVQRIMKENSQRDPFAETTIERKKYAD